MCRLAVYRLLAVCSVQTVFKLALTLLVERQEGRVACKKISVRVLRGYLSGARCRFAYGLTDATATHYLAPVNPDWFYLYGSSSGSCHTGCLAVVQSSCLANDDCVQEAHKLVHRSVTRHSQIRHFLLSTFLSCNTQFLYTKVYIEKVQALVLQFGPHTTRTLMRIFAGLCIMQMISKWRLCQNAPNPFSYTSTKSKL